jgi:tripartite-type tricarboxylate transporter receptor subunit TctC
LGQSVIVENRPGVASIVGASYVAKAKPDGYTLLMGASGPIVFNHVLYAKLPYTPQDFAPISLVGTFPLVLLTNANNPAKSVSEMVSYAKQNPDKVNYSSPSASFQLIAELFNGKTGTRFQHIPYKGSAFALPDLIAGNTLMMFDSVTASLPHIQSGKLRPIAIAAAERSPLMPNVPTLGQDGMKQFDVENLYAFYAPKGTSPAIVARLEREIRKILTNPDFKARLGNQGIHPQFANSEQLLIITQSEKEKWTKVVKSADVKID